MLGFETVKIKRHFKQGHLMVELMIVIGLAAIILPALAASIGASREGKPDLQKRLQATALLKETETAVKSVKEKNWNAFATNGTYSPQIVSNTWIFASGSATTNGFTQSVVISDVKRDSEGAIVSDGTGTVDPSTKKAEISISWTQPSNGSILSTLYLARTDNLTHTDTTEEDFLAGTLDDVQVTNASGGEVRLSNNNKAKWCSPELSTVTIDLPDGPPVAVAAHADPTDASIPNDAIVATGPNDSSSIKMAHVHVTADDDIPYTTLRGKFTLNSSEYSSGTHVPSGTGFTNSFKTTDVEYYEAPSGNTYALIGTSMPNKEVIAIWIDDNNASTDSNTTGEFQDHIAKIYKYKTFFNTKRYYYDTSSTPNQDQSPYGYGASTITVEGNRGYVASGGYLYTFDLSNIDGKSATNGLDMMGCRIQLDGYECKPGTTGSYWWQTTSGTAAKYSSSQTGTSFGDSTSPIHNDCSDGGNVELLATEDIDAVSVGSNHYVFVAVGGVTNPEFEVVNTSTVPSYSRSDDSTCGRISGGDSSWKVISTLDFNSQSNTEEAANSVYAKSDGTRAYVSSNGGIDGNNNGSPDSKQFYVINTSNKSNVSFLSGSSSTQPTSGFYEGTGANLEMYPRRSLTVLDGERAVLVGTDAISNGNDAEEYQVLDMENESTPTYCSGINFDQGFNDLTSVSEADYDNYVYMVANTSQNELKIIEGGPDDAIYVPNGTFTSPTFDTASVDGVASLRAFNRILASVAQPTGTSVEVQTAVAPAILNSCSGIVYDYVGPDGTDATRFSVSGSTIEGVIPLQTLIPTSNYQNPGRCFSYKVFMSTADQTKTPVFNDIIWNYSQ